MNVVSFLCPRPEHPFYQDYRPFLALLRESCARYGHQHIVLTDDPMEIGDGDAYQVEVPRSLMRAYLAAQLAYLSDPALADQPTLLTGADCVLANDPEVFARLPNADMVITVGDFADCHINMGAIYIPRPAAVAHIWVDALARCGDEWGDDQRAFRDALAAAIRAPLRIVELPVDPYNLAPETPSEDCTRGVVLHFRGPRKAWMVDYCHKWLGIGSGVTLTVQSNLPEAEMMEHVRVNIRRGLPEVRSVEAHDGNAVLIGGGPSLAGDVDEIKWRKSLGQTVFGLNGTSRWLLEHGIAPDYGVILDPRADNAKFLCEGVAAWLIASQCHPDVFEELAGHESVKVWHFASPHIHEAVPGGMAIGGGLTVGLSAMGLAFAMGYRKLHLYGYDSSDADGAAHAYEQSECPAEARRVEVWCDGRRFTSGAAMYAQAEAFPRWAELLAEHGAIITVHGDGLLPTLARCMNSATQIGAMAA